MALIRDRKCLIPWRYFGMYLSENRFSLQPQQCPRVHEPQNIKNSSLTSCISEKTIWHGRNECTDVAAKRPDVEYCENRHFQREKKSKKVRER